MKITKRQLRRIIRETSSDEYLLSEKNWEKEAEKLEQEDEAQSGEIRTIGDLKRLIKQAQAKKRGEQTKGNIKGAIKDALVDEILGKIPFAGTAKTLFDFVKDSYNLPDESRTGTALDHLDVDDDVAKIVDDPIENAFLDAFGEKLDELSDDKALEDLNMTKNLSDYLGNEFNNRTVSGFHEGRRLRKIKRNLKKAIYKYSYLHEQRTIASASDIVRLKHIFDEWVDLLIDELSDKLPNGTAIKDFSPKKRKSIVDNLSKLIRIRLIDVLGYPSDPYIKKRLNKPY